MSALDYQILAYVVWGYWAASLGLALLLGDLPARLVAASALAAYLAGEAAQAFWHAPAVWATWADAAILAPMLAVTLRWRRKWLVWMCAFQLATVGTYVAYRLDPAIGGLAYATAVNTWGVLAQSALLWGAWRAIRARRLGAA